MEREKGGIRGFFKGLGEYYSADDVNRNGVKRQQEIQSNRARYPTEDAAKFEEEVVRLRTKVSAAIYGLARKAEVIPVARGLEKAGKGTAKGVITGLKNLFHRSHQESAK